MNLCGGETSGDKCNKKGDKQGDKQAGRQAQRQVEISASGQGQESNQGTSVLFSPAHGQESWPKDCAEHAPATQ